MFGYPALLVTDAIEKVCLALEKTNADKKIKIILMNTTGNSNRDLSEKNTCITKNRYINFKVAASATFG
jgi:hypothetical protein